MRYTTGHTARRRLRLFPLLVVVLLPLATFAQDTPLPPSLFSGFETQIFPNGLTVWYKHLPDDPIVSIRVVTPFGSDQDPPGKEQLAHFTEHMLFSDHLGRTEEQIKREIEDRGGVRNAVTTWDHTYYFVHIGKEHGLFALEWLHRIVSPHAMDPAVVDRQRDPVALEVSARPREFFDWLQAYFLDPSRLRLPGFWEREFGLETRRSRDYYPHRSLHRISPDDLRGFYDTYYIPSRMTLAIIGDLNRDTVLKKISETFATLPARPEPVLPEEFHDPKRYRQTFSWSSRSNIHYLNLFKFYRFTPRQNVMLIFLSRFLGKRLNAKLRFGERKAVYGISVGVTRRGPAMYLSIDGRIKESEFEFARNVIEQELEALRTGTLPDAEFEADREAVTRQLRFQNTSAKELGRWVSGAFYDPRLHRDFPDLVTFFDRVTKAEVEAFVHQHFVPERQVLSIGYRHLFTQGLRLALALALWWVTVKAARRLFVRSVVMTRIRYVARFKLPLLHKIVGGAISLVLLAVGVRLLAYGFAVLADRFLRGVENFWVQSSGYALAFMATIFVVILVLGRVPRKLLLFDDHLLIKYLSYRSLRLAPADIAEASLRRFPAVWLSRRLWKCVPLTFGLFSPGIYLKRRNGWAYFFGARKSDELLRLLQELTAVESPATPGAVR